MFNLRSFIENRVVSDALLELLLRAMLQKRRKQRGKKLQAKLGPIKITVNLDLLYRLTGLTKKDAKPQLVFGPIDRVGGFFRSDNGDIEIDILEIFFRKKPKTAAEFDVLVTNTVAHEMRHAWQRKHWGEGILIFFQFLIIVLPLVYIAAWHPVATSLSQYGLFWGVFGWYLEISPIRKILHKLCYLLMPHEWDARRYAKRATANPVWNNVVNVEGNGASFKSVHSEIKSAIESGELK
ncbi:MAG: hypothetical protein ACPGO5_04100 [Patescibacteria group bacterium]